MTTQTMIHILENRKNITSNPTEIQLLTEVVSALERLDKYEREDNNGDSQS